MYTKLLAGFPARLFSRHPKLVPYFEGARVDALFHHFGLALEIVAVSFDELWKVRRSAAAAAAAEQPQGIRDNGRDNKAEAISRP